MARMKLVPLGGVASHVSRTIVQHPPAAFESRSPPPLALDRVGAVFCFLPLPPLETGFHANINAYFELSANRRNIWFGADAVSDETHSKSKWNLALLHDVVAPSLVDAICYAVTLVQTTPNTTTSPTSQSSTLATSNSHGDNVHLLLEDLYSLVPTTCPPEPWDVAYIEVWRQLEDKPLWFSPGLGRWVTVADAVFTVANHLNDDSTLEEQQHTSTRMSPSNGHRETSTVPENNPTVSSRRDTTTAAPPRWLLECMAAERACVVPIPRHIFETLKKQRLMQHELDASFVRSVYRNSAGKRRRHHPSLLITSPHSSNTGSENGGDDERIDLALAVKLLALCLGDLHRAGSFEELHGISLVPMADGSLGCIDDGGLGMRNANDNSKSALKDLIRPLQSFYERHNPENVGTVGRVLEGFGDRGNVKGRQLLEAALLKRYGEGLGAELTSALEPHVAYLVRGNAFDSTRAGMCMYGCVCMVVYVWLCLLLRNACSHCS
jgi:hypothetical protein